MVEINLLPWRHDKQRYEQNQRRKAVIIGGAVGVLLVMLLHVIVDKQNQQAAEAIRQLETVWLARSKFSDSPAAFELDKKDWSGLAVARLLAAAAASTLNGVCYQSISFDSEGLLLKGRARYPQSILSGLQAFTTTLAPQRLQLALLSQIKDSDDYEFELRESSVFEEE